MSEQTSAAGSKRPIVVMKFGGTSVATEEGRQALGRRVTAALEYGRAPVVVVSAMGRAGAPYATDTLLALVEGMPSSDRELDMLATTGELISAVLTAHELRASGVDAVAFSGADAGILTDGVHGDAAIHEIHTARLREAIEAGNVPVVAGFQGISEDGRVTALGRGGSDTTACALGVALEAEEVEIYTDVDGVMSADPRSCDGAALLETIDAEELFHMAKAGSKVVHTPAAELALSSGLTLRIRNTFSEHQGTQVADLSAYRAPSVATAVSRIDGVCRLRLALPADEGTSEHSAIQAGVYRAMADAGISLDMFTPAGRSLFLTLASSRVQDATRVLDALGIEHDVQPGLSKVTLVGGGMHGVPGVMARVAEYLAARSVPVLQTADSHTTISVLVPEEAAEMAVQALHDGFELDQQ